MLLEGEKFANPYVNDENKAIKDIKAWKEQLVLPLSGHDWSSAQSYSKKADRNKHLIGCMIVSGLFERTHTLMGFQDALINFMTEPENMSGPIGALAEWKIEPLRQVIDEKVIRTEVRGCIDEYCPQGYFIPCISNIVPIHPDVNAIYEDE